MRKKESLASGLCAIKPLQMDMSTRKVNRWTCTVYKIGKLPPKGDDDQPVPKSLTEVSLKDDMLKKLLTDYGYQLVHFWAEKCNYEGLLYLCDDLTLFKAYLAERAVYTKIKFTHIRPRAETYAADIIGIGFGEIYTVPDVKKFLQDAFDTQAFPAGLALELEKRRKRCDCSWYALPAGAKQDHGDSEYEFLGDSPHIEIHHRATSEEYDCAKKAALEAVEYLEGGKEKIPDLEAAIDNLDPVALGKQYFGHLCQAVCQTTGLETSCPRSTDFDPFNPFPEGKNIKLVLGK